MKIYVCPECGQYNGHFAGCPEDVAPDNDDAGPDDDEGDDQLDETPDEFQTMANSKEEPRARTEKGNVK